MLRVSLKDRVPERGLILFCELNAFAPQKQLSRWPQAPSPQQKALLHKCFRNGYLVWWAGASYLIATQGRDKCPLGGPVRTLGLSEWGLWKGELSLKGSHLTDLGYHGQIPPPETSWPSVGFKVSSSGLYHNTGILEKSGSLALLLVMLPSTPMACRYSLLSSSTKISLV